MKKLYRFGSFTLEDSTRILRRDGKPVAMPPKALLTLVTLVQADGRVISKAELLKAVWPDTYVEENALAQIVWALRKQLAVGPESEGAIETVTRVGYRFCLAVTIGEENDQALGKKLALEPPSNEGRPGGPARRMAWWRGLTAGLVGVAVAILAWSVTRPWRHDKQWGMSQMTTNDSDHRVGAAAISPDGLTLAYTDANGLYLREMQTGRTRQLKAPGLSAVRLQWFRDQTRLLLTGFEREEAVPEIWVVSVDGETKGSKKEGQQADGTRLLRRDANDGAPSSDGISVAFTVEAGQAIRLMRVDGTGERTLLKGSADRVFSALFWSANGKRLSYQQRVPAGQPGTEIEQNYVWSYCSLDLQTGQETVLAQDLPFDSAQETADGEMYYLRSHPAKDLQHNGLWRVKTEPETGRFLGTPKRFYALGEEPTNSISVSSDGNQVSAVRHLMVHSIYVADLVKPGPVLTNMRRLTSTLSNDFPYAWDSSNKAVYFESNRVGDKYHLFRQSTDNANAEMLSVGEKQQFFPTLMPDGKTLIYEEWAVVKGKTQRTIFRANADGEYATPVYQEGELDEWRCPLSTGTSCVLRETAGQKRFTFYALDLVTGKGQQLAYSPWQPTFLGDWALSPDGSIAAIPSHDPLTPSIRLVPLRDTRGERELRLNESALLSEIHWAADMQGFYVEAQIGMENELQYVDLNGEVHRLLAATGNTWGLPSKDGKKLAFAGSTISRNVFVWR